MRKFRWAFVIVSLLLVWALVSACAGGSGTSTTSTGGGSGSGSSGNAGSGQTTDKQTVELRVAWWGGQARHDMQNSLMDKFEELYPHIKVKREFTDFAGYWDRLATQTAGGNAPDVITFHPTYLSDYAKRGALMPLDDLVAQGKINLSDFDQAIIDSGKYDGKIYMVTLGNSIPGVFYNKKLFDEAGVPYPDMDWTWDDFMDTALKLSEKLNGDRWALQRVGGFNGFVRQRGKEYFAADGKLGFDKQDLIDFFNMHKRLLDAGALPDANTAAEYLHLEHERSLFGNERTALLFMNSNQLPIYQRLVEGELGIVREPVTPGGQTGEAVTGAYLAISADTKYPEEAALLIDFWLNHEAAIDIFKTEHGPLGSKKMNEYIKPRLEPAQVKMIEYVETVAQYARPQPDRPLNASEVEELYNLAEQAINFGAKSVEQAVDDFFAEAEKILQ